MKRVELLTRSGKYDTLPTVLEDNNMQEIRNMKELGAVIRNVRKAQKVNQTLLAQASNVGVRLIVDIERGKPTVQIDKLLAVMNRLGMTVLVEPPKGI